MQKTDFHENLLLLTMASQIRNKTRLFVYGTSIDVMLSSRAQLFS